MPRDCSPDTDLLRADIVRLLRRLADPAIALDISESDLIEVRRLLLKRPMLREFQRLCDEGKRRMAATYTARKYALDMDNPIEVESLSHWLRCQARRASAFI